MFALNKNVEPSMYDVAVLNSLQRIAVLLNLIVKEMMVANTGREVK